MKDEIQQVLKMNKEGTLTDEQATELIAELAQKDQQQARENFGTRDWDRSGFVEPLMSKMNTTVKHALDAAFGWRHPGAPGGMGGHGPAGFQGEAFAEPDQNAIHMSRFDTPAGKDHVFTGNAVRMSSVKDVRLERAEMTRNTIDMSKVHDFSVRDGKVSGCEIRASSVEDWNIDGAVASGVSVQELPDTEVDHFAGFEPHPGA